MAQPSVSTQNFFAVTMNCDLVSTAAAANPNWTDYRDNKLGASTWGLIPFSTAYFAGSREGQAMDLPINGVSAWTPPPYISDLMSTSICPWFRPYGQRLLIGDQPLPIASSTAIAEEQGQLEIKWRVGKILNQTTTYFIWGILGPNEPEKLASLSGAMLGETTREIRDNLAHCARAMHEQIWHLTTGLAANFSTNAKRSSDICLVGPSFAEPIASTITNGTNLYDLFKNTDYLESVDCISGHHHTGVGSYDRTYDFNGNPPATGAISLYHVCKAKENSGSTKIHPLVYDESGMHMRLASAVTGWGWNVTPVDYEKADDLRYLRTGSWVAGILQWAPAIWYAYALETGASDYLYDRQSSQQSAYGSWTYMQTMANWERYKISVITTSDHTVPIVAKGSTDLSDLQTIAVRVNTNGTVNSSWHSATPPFTQWRDSSFTNGQLRLLSGTTKLVDIPCFFETTAEHTFSVTAQVTGSTSGGIRLRAMGYDNTKGHAITQSTVLWGGEGQKTVSITIEPKTHGDIRVPGDPNSALFSILHNGLGTAAITEIKIESAATADSPQIISIGNMGSNTNAQNSTLFVSFPTFTTSTNQYVIMAVGNRLGPTQSGATFDDQANWSLIKSTHGTVAPSFWVYGRYMTSTMAGSTIGITFLGATDAAVIARGQMFVMDPVTTSATPYESATQTHYASLVAATTWLSPDFYSLGEYREAVLLSFYNGQTASPTWTGEDYDWQAEAFESSAANLSIGIWSADIATADLQGNGAWETTGANARFVGFAILPNTESEGYQGNADVDLPRMTLAGLGGADRGGVLDQNMPAPIVTGVGGQEVVGTLSAALPPLPLRRGKGVIGDVVSTDVNPSVYGYHMRGKRRVKTCKFTVT